MFKYPNGSRSFWRRSGRIGNGPLFHQGALFTRSIFMGLCEYKKTPEGFPRSTGEPPITSPLRVPSSALFADLVFIILWFRDVLMFYLLLSYFIYFCMSNDFLLFFLIRCKNLKWVKKRYFQRELMGIESRT